MATLRASGRRESDFPALPEGVTEALGGATVKDAIRVGAVRDDTERPRVEFDEASDVLALEFEGGLRSFISLADFRDDYGIAAARDAGDELDLPVHLGRTAASRGLKAALALKFFRVIGVPLEEVTASAVAKHFEAALTTGLRAWSEPADLDAGVVDPDRIPGAEPILVFLHGTASSTLGSFGRLATEHRDVWDELQRTYADRVFAFEHRTLSQSPIENVIDLVEQLPHGARLHLVSHSRGGLLGELLCRAEVHRDDDGPRDPFDDLDLRQFDDPAYSEQRRQLVELRDLLRARQPRVERFVRVACPAAGTLLASKRLDRYFSLLVNVIGKATGLGQSFVYDFVTSLAIAAAKERTDPSTLPGIEAMVPGSPLVKVLNRPGVRVPADLSIIAGDIEGSGLWQRLKVIATDLFYLEDHDLVVHTRSMYGGTPRVEPARAFFDKGSHVSHFNYFANAGSARQVLKGLTRSPAEPAGFKPVVVSARAVKRSARGEGEPPPQGLVFVLPGIMGSHLGVEGRRIWLNLARIAGGAMKDLVVDQVSVEAQALLGRPYADLVEHLRGRYEVVPYPYDWRRSLLETGRRFGAELKTALETSPLTVGIVAHSMGGVLVRAMIAECPDAWAMFKQRGGRVVMLGTPNRGSFTINSVLLGRDPVVRNLARLDFAHDRLELLRIIRRFPGLLELLPMDDEPHDFLAPERWRELHAAAGDGWEMPDASDLKAASRLRGALTEATIDPERMTYIAGRAPATPVGVEIEDGRLIVKATAEGDGRVPWATGILPDVRTWYVDASHGKLADHRASFPAIVDLLEQGTTDRLRETPSVARGSTAPFDLPEEEPPIFPSEEDMEGAALGFEIDLEPKESEPPIKVYVTHGDLCFAGHPVLMGHYQGDAIVGAERVLDEKLGKRLQQRRDLGNYAGPVKTFSVVLDAGAKPPGAIIVGLGPVGRLAPGDLRRTIAHGLREYALRWVERYPGPSFHPLTVTSLLVGSGEGGLPLEDVVNAILEGAYEANEALLATALAQSVRIDRVELLEVHLDRAVQASRILQQLSSDQALAGRFEIPDWRVQRGRGGYQRVVTYERDADWWTRLQITEDESTGLLHWVALTDRARAEARFVPTQRSSLDAFLREAVQTTRANADVSRTLFDLLVPNALKDAAPQQRDVVLVVDKASARYPWELLQDGADQKSPPMAVQSGLIRQMQTPTFRETVVSTSERTALVVGDPKTTTFAPLDGAKREAEAVKRQLEQEGFAVTPVIRPDHANDVFTALFARSYRLIHLAGHGVYEHEVTVGVGDDGLDCPASICPLRTRKRTVTGMVLADDVFLTPAEVNQMRTVPELVFINCCHLGSEEGGLRNGDKERFLDLAANLGTQLIENGARAVIAAGWAVEDDAAELFARTFYEKLLAGESFGRAVTAARCATWDACGGPDGSNTWGAYQCYGDPSFVLVKRGDAGRTDDHDADDECDDGGRGKPDADDRGPVLAVVEEAIHELGNLKALAASASYNRLPRLRRRIRSLAKRLPEAWMDDARLLEALGSAYGEARQFEDAIRCFDRARTSEKAFCSVRGLETMANLRPRWAVDLWQAASNDTSAAPRDPKEEIKRALKEIDALITIGETSERFSLRGSAYKRQAWITKGKARDTALGNMADAYEAGHRLALEITGKADFYPAINWVNACVLANIRGQRLRDHRGRFMDIDRELADIEAAVEAVEEPSFWSAIASIDLEVVRHLHAGDLDARRDEFAQRYLREREWGSAREFSSVLEHLAFLREILSEPPRSKAPDQPRRTDGLAGVSAMLEQLEGVVGPA